MSILSRIVKSIIKNGNECKTTLSMDTHVNYSRLAKHVIWLENKGFAESTVNNSKISIGLTEKGREFASIIIS